MAFRSWATRAAFFGSGVAPIAVLGAVTTGCSSNSTGAAPLLGPTSTGDASTDDVTSGSSGGTRPDAGSGPGREGGSGPGSDGSSPGSDSGPGLGADDASDGATSDVAGACNAFSADGPLVAQTMLAGSQPNAMGGHVYSGTYWLTERDTYGGTPDKLFVQRSLVIDATTVNVVGGDTASDAGMPAWTTTTSSYQVLDVVVLTLTESCPGPPHVTNLQFTAVGGQLTLYPTMDTAEVYALQ
jgi:hypothetical protein